MKFYLFVEHLIYDVDSNVVEHFHSIVAKFVGGKRTNLPMSDSYTARCTAALVQHNTQEAYAELIRTVFVKSPNGRLKRLLSRRKSNNLKQCERRRRIKFRKSFFSNRDVNYGTETCQKPDKTDEELNVIREDIVKTLKENKKKQI